MNHFIASLLLCIICIISISFPSGSKFVNAVVSKNNGGGRSISNFQRVRKIRNNYHHIISTLTNTTDNSNSTNATTPTQAPTSAQVPTAPIPPTTHAPTKHYTPSPPDDDDNNESEIEKDAIKVGWIFFYIVITFAVIWALLYYRDAVFFFLSGAYNNTRNYGCRGCLHSFFPCFFGSIGGGNQPLDQIIFETEDPNTPLVPS